MASVPQSFRALQLGAAPPSLIQVLIVILARSAPSHLVLLQVLTGRTRSQMILGLSFTKAMQYPPVGLVTLETSR